VLGLFTGGTLCDEARRLVGDAACGFVDFGAEEYTRGRPHPMIDPALRSAALVRAGDEAGVGVLLLDVVLGSCAHPDPAAAAATAIAEARVRAARQGRRLAVVAHVVGTEDDPQGLAAQEDALRALDVVVCASNRLAARAALTLARGD
jgi:FdrA protein